MANHWLQQSIQQQHHQHLVHQSETFKNLYNTNSGQISPPVAYFSGNDLPDQSQHPPYIPQSPYPVPGSDGSDGVPWNYGFEPRKKRLKEQDFFENNSQILPVDFFQTRSVSTGLGLSLDNGRLGSSGDSSFRGIIRNEIDSQLLKHNADIDQYLRVQVEQLRQEILEKVETNQMRTISYVEQKVIEKLRVKEDEVENINKMNMKLEHQIEQFAVEAHMWQQRSEYTENMINELGFSLEQINARTGGDSKEGCGDSEVDDTASCYNDQTRPTTTVTCKICKAKGVCMLLLPCKHLCLCKDCENGIRVCPICQSLKIMSLEVFV
ncbi:probable BOI-related E3 ubiquitin-protein ligase 3 isoform X2 [Impatiens glandulifera]|uniref:probable BOI-related E3 ubiquitin-protein ligase 3 isoform X2 n=1 Tax=Impatiens glandulifera TaxID=253017 RepID=UPI001FB069F1|nr:probable BOI-related E3 ubiquitin-protein ligase 3 isoform X2 [Impatiens glandulifera]